ncbi:AMP-binding protein [Marinobacter aromaticivorans]|uniref:AMP-binding protein n=1 Tax=Marinobacter aromaticivorans TaxID=1494078 RepID=A0ABW2IX12_9GAMM|nr:AMP-binding protein [Marinobacter aromaticivorans]
MTELFSVYRKLPPKLQDLALSTYGLLLRRLRYGKVFHQTLASLEAGKLNPLLDQSERLSEMVAVALQQTEHYGKLRGSQSLTESEIGVSNFTGFFPVLEKSTVKRSLSAFHSKGFGKNSTTTLSTSGTTGNPLNVLASKQAIRQNYAFFNLFLRSIGVDEFQRSATFAGRLIVPAGNKAPPYWRKNYAMNTLLCSSYHLSTETIPFYIKALEEWQPVFIDSYPSAIYEIASFINAKNIEHGIRLKAVVTSSETLGDHQRTAIEKAFKCPVFDQYGCAEMAVMAYQQKDGRYFIPPQYSIVEVLDDNDRPVKPGESGHLVCTGLLNKAMPLIRYRIGDIVKTSEAQLEGYPYILFLDSIEGRNDDVVITSNGSRVGRLGPVFKGVQGICEAQIVQKTRTLLQVNLVISSDYSETTENQLRKALEEHVGASMQISFKYPDKIIREKNGKFKFVKSEL